MTTTLPFNVDTTLAWALSYAARGWNVFPSPPDAKMSYKSESVHGTKWGSTTDPDQIRADFARWPEANVGVKCGFESAVFVIETDEKDGRDGAANLVRLGELPDTYVVTTPSGSVHRYFRHPGGDFRVRNSESKLAVGVDVRGDGGMVIAPPSRHKSGAGYYTVTNMVEVVDAPNWLLDLVDDKRKSVPVVEPVSDADCSDTEYGLTRLAKLETALRNAADGERNATLNTQSLMAGKLVGGGQLRRETAIDRLTGVALEIGLEEGETAATINSGLRKGLTDPERPKTAAEMFAGVAGTVANIASTAGATLPGAIPMDGGQAELTRLATPILQGFLDATASAPNRPNAVDLPQLPPQMSGHGLFELMSSALERVFVLAETKAKPTQFIDPLSVLHQMHSDVFESVCRRLRAAGLTLPDKKIKNASAALQESVERITVTHDKWEYDRNGQPESDNPDNVVVLLGVLDLSLRWNLWLERMELQGGTSDLRWPNWTYVDDTVIAKLLTRARRTKTRFRPGKDFLWETLLTLAHENSVDPVLDTLNDLAAAWDGQPRLITWLSRYCGTPCDPLHQAYGKLIFGGLVKRARIPGYKFDFMPVFYGPQGTGKSSLLSIMAFRPEWFTDSILLGDASKELVLSLAGKLVVEISEMGMRGNTNANHVKAMITRTTDSGRTAYARAVTERDRRNIFCGTTNDRTPLEDPTGNRRFLPIHITRAIDLVAFRKDIGQLIGEAAALNTSAELPSDLWEAAARQQEAARAMSDIEVLLMDWLGGDAAGFITKSDVVRLCDATGRKNTSQVVHSIMERLGFKDDASPTVEGKKARVWYRSPVVMLPKHVLSLPRYRVDVTTNGNPRVVLRNEANPDAMLPPPPVR